MTETNALSLSQFLDFLLHAAPVRPVLGWGPPGIGKSELVRLLGSQLAAEDLVGVPQTTPEGASQFWRGEHCPETALRLFLVR